jgi:hypothetical protein
LLIFYGEKNKDLINYRENKNKKSLELSLEEHFMDNKKENKMCQMYKLIKIGDVYQDKANYILKNLVLESILFKNLLKMLLDYKKQEQIYLVLCIKIEEFNLFLIN